MLTYSYPIVVECCLPSSMPQQRLKLQIYPYNYHSIDTLQAYIMVDISCTRGWLKTIGCQACFTLYTKHAPIQNQIVSVLRSMDGTV